VVNLSSCDWPKKSLGEVCDILAGFGFPERLQGRTEGDLPFFKVGDISEAWKRGEVYLTKANHYVTHSDAQEIRGRPLPANTTVFAKIGAAIALNRRAILSEPSLVDNNVMGLHPASTELDHKFLFHFVCTQKLDELSRATTVPSVRKSDIEQISIPVPPLDEQREIVAEIEKQFTRLEAGVAGLRRVQANLKRYRAAVLKAACEGKLVPTEAELARQESRIYETGAQLLERVLTERRQKWNGRGKYKEPAKPDTTNLPPLPEGWSWARLDAIAALKGGITVDKNRKSLTARCVPYLRVANVQRGYLDLMEIKEIKAPENDIAELRLLPGDILFTEGGDRDKLGRGWIWQGQISECIHQNHVFRARPYSAEVQAKFVSWWGNSFGQVHFLREGKQTTNLASINLSKLNQFPVPIPPAAEQQLIVAEVERSLSVLEGLEAVANANLQRATRLRQSILQRAFEGN
jgi:type I restriction enzyme S subunit